MDKNQSETSSGLTTIFRIVIIGVILLLLVFLSIGIVRIVPKTLNSLANASLSIGDLFSNSTSTSSTDTDPNTGSTPTPTTSVSISTSTNGGFSIRELTTTSSTSTSQTISGNTSGVGTSANAGATNTNTGTIQTNTQSNTNTHTSSQTSGQTSVSSGYTSTARTVGPSDIAVEVISKGIIDKTTGQYIPTNTFTTSDMVVVKFKIENRGQYATGVWAARVDMPSQNASDQVRTLGPISSLPGGSAITGEARFDRPTAGTPSVVISVDTSSATQDTNRNNNSISLPISVTGSNTGGSGSVIGSGSMPDLQVRIISTGIVNDYGQYTPNTTPRYGQKAAIQFEVTNYGGVPTGTWTWRADISGAVNSTYTSPAEASLGAGASTRLIVGFPIGNSIGAYGQYPYYGGSTVSYSLLVDSANTIYESSEANNTAYINQTISY